MKKPLRIGIVGWGEIAGYHARHARSLGAILGGVVSRRPLEIEAPVFSTLEEMLPHVDAVTIAVPNHLHASSCLDAARAPKPLLIEKPLCIDESELSSLEKTLPEAASPIVLGYRLRWNPAIIELRKSLTDPSLISCTYRIGSERLGQGKSWLSNPAMSGGPFLTIAVHALDLARWLARAEGEPLQRLRAKVGDERDRYGEPLLVEVSGSLASGPRIIARADLRGSGDFELDLNISASAGGYPEGLPGPVPDEEGAYEIEYRNMFRDFLARAASNDTNPDEVKEFLQTHRELLLARRLTR